MKIKFGILFILLIISVLDVSGETITFEGKKYDGIHMGVKQEYYEILMDSSKRDSKWIITYSAIKPNWQDWGDWREISRIPADGLFLTNLKLYAMIQPTLTDTMVVQDNLDYDLFFRKSKEWWSEGGFFNVLYDIFIINKL